MQVEIGKAYTDGENNLVLIFEMKDYKSAKYPDHNLRAIRFKEDYQFSLDTYTEEGRFFTNESLKFDLYQEADEAHLYKVMTNLKPRDLKECDIWLDKFYKAYVKRNSNEAPE